MSDIQNNSSSQPHENTKPVKPKHRQWGTATLALLFGIGGLVAGRLGQLYPHFDVFSQFGAQFIMGICAFAFALLFRRFKTLVGIVLTLLFLALYGAWPHLVSTPLTKGPFTLQADEKQLRVAHFNTFAENFDYDAITSEILRLDADVVTLVETDAKKKAAILPALRSVYPYNYDCSGQDFCELAILSKYPIVEAQGQGHWVGAPYVRAALGGEMTGVTIMGVHTTRFPRSRAQLKQIREMVRLIETMTGDVVVMGDFNATPFSRITTTLEQGANLTRLTQLPTWPTTLELPQLAIDHAFASKNFRVIGNQQIGEASGSDHYPFVLTLALKRNP